MSNNSNLSELMSKLGIEFKNEQLLLEALTHRSYLNENPGADTDHNERMEFLGDAVLELVVSEHLFNTYTNRPEGDLTSFRAATVRTTTLADVSREIGTGEYLRMSKGEEATGGRDKDYLLANVFESVLGALYLDQGYSACVEFVEKWLHPRLEHIVKYRWDIDAKTKFQEIAQNLFKTTPVYKLISSEGPDHEKVFTMAVCIGDKEFGRGVGTSKQKAEESAAEIGIKNLNKIDKSAFKA